MANTKFNTRIQVKNDTEANWNKAINFVPLKGEIIVYTDLNKIKIGDGTTNVNNLNFINNVFKVNATSVTANNNGGGFHGTVDKSAAEIISAIQAGYLTIVYVAGMGSINIIANFSESVHGYFYYGTNIYNYVQTENNFTLNEMSKATKTSDLTNDSGFLTSIPDEYITEEELEAKHYLTNHQDVSNKANLNETPRFITEDMVTVATDATKGTSPYNASYGYTNITVNSGITEDDLHVGLVIAPIVFSKLIVASANRNVRIRFGSSGAWHPFYQTTAILVGSSYFTKGNTRFYVYRTDINSSGAFHMLNDSNSTYSPVSLGFGYATCTTAEATAAKVATLSSYNLTTNGIVAVKFTNAVPANATLNINGKGAKNIYYNGQALPAGIIKAGMTATFVYSAQYHLIALNKPVSDSVESANKLVNGSTPRSLGSSIQPVYFSDGVPLSIGYTIEKSVPSNAEFTDTKVEWGSF